MTARRWLIIVTVLISSPMLAGNLLEWRNTGTPPYQGGTISNCGTPKVVDFIVTYAYNFNVNSTTTPTPPSCPSAFGANPYRVTFELYRDNVPLGTHNAQYSSCWARHLFAGIPAQPGNYTVRYRFERRQLFSGWSTWENANTNAIQAVNVPAAPNFTVNGQVIPSDGTPVSVNIKSTITMDGSSTQCAPSYWVGVHESEANWNRTFAYEWGKWFNGSPPNDINLQQLATTYSRPPDFTGSAARYGTPLIGGYLDPPANTKPRYYRLELCTGEPAWLCKHALLRVNY